MSALKNPYLSNDSQNLLIRKNYKVIQSSENERLFPNYKPNKQTLYNKGFAQKNHRSLVSTAEFSSMSNLRNSFSTKVLGERNQNSYRSYSNLPTFYTQPYLSSSMQKKQLPFPSLNRPQSTNKLISSFSSSKKVTNILSLSRRNLAVSNVKISSTQSLQKNLTLKSTPYRPHFVSPTSRNINNQWNSQRWKQQLQLRQREKLQKYGSQGLRYDDQLKSNNNLLNLNSEYYSTSSLQRQMYKINVQKPPLRHHINQSKGKNVVLFDQQQHKQQENQQQLQVKQYLRNNNLKNQTNNSSSSNSLTIPQNRDGYHHYKRKQKTNININKFSDIGQQSQIIQNIQSKIQQFNHNHNDFIRHSKNHLLNHHNILKDGSDSMMKSIVGNEYDLRDKDSISSNDDYDGNPQQFMSKYQQKQNQHKQFKKGPLDLDAFDSVHRDQQDQFNDQNDRNQGQNQQRSQLHRFVCETFGVKKMNQGQQIQQNSVSSQIVKKKTDRIVVQSKNTLEHLMVKRKNRNKLMDNKYTNQDKYCQKQYPPRVQFRDKLFYRIKLSEDRK